METNWMIEQTILSNLTLNEEYTRKVIPYLKPEYFHDYTERSVFGLITKYFDKYNRVPDNAALLVELSNAEGLSDDQHSSAQEFINKFGTSSDEEWLIDETEKFCQDKAI